jgi:hypothetical protein
MPRKKSLRLRLRQIRRWVLEVNHRGERPHGKFRLEMRPHLRELERR